MKLVLVRHGMRTKFIKISHLYVKKHIIGYTYVDSNWGSLWDKHFLAKHYDIVYVMFDSFEQAALYMKKANVALFLMNKRGEWDETQVCRQL